MERPDAGLKYRVVCNCGQEDGDAPHLLALLRTHGKRPHRRATEPSDEFAPTKPVAHGAYRGNIARPKAVVPGAGACPLPGPAGKGGPARYPGQTCLNEGNGQHIHQLPSLMIRG
jgi:hypothetical protein